MGAEKLYYSIKEVSELLKEPESTLRYWEKVFPEFIHPSRKDQGLGVKTGVRYYSEKDVEDVRLIQYLLRDCGLTLDGAHLRLKNNLEGAAKHAKLLFRLKNIKADLKALGEAMDHVAKIQTA